VLCTYELTPLRKPRITHAHPEWQPGRAAGLSGQLRDPVRAPQAAALVRGSIQLPACPTVPFHFVGHSNGTYLFGHSLRNVRALRFARVYLGGSVLPGDFDWLSIAGNGQVDNLVNVCATKDKPVGWLCSLLRGLGRDDVGTGGFDNFDVVAPASAKQFHSLVEDMVRRWPTVDSMRSHRTSRKECSTLGINHLAASCASLGRCSASCRVWRPISPG
jgi:hypothetical protein